VRIGFENLLQHPSQVDRQKAGDSILDHLRYSSHRKCDYGKPRRKSLQQNARHSFLFGRNNQNIQIAHHAADIVLPVQELHRQSRRQS